MEVFLNNEWICIISIYVPPYNTSSKNNIPISINAFENVMSSRLPIICGGDFNCRMIEAGDSSYNFNGRVLANYLLNVNLFTVFPKQPTCYRSESGSRIDFFVLSNDFRNESPGLEQNSSFSDHDAIILNISFEHEGSNNELNRIYSYSYTKVKQLNKFIEEKIDDLKIPVDRNINKHELDSIATSIENIFREAIQQNVPVINVPNGKILLSQNSIILKRRLNKLSKALYNNQFVHNKCQIKREIKLIKTMYKNAVKSDLNNYYKNLINKTSCNMDVYGLIKQTTRHKKRSNVNNMAITDVDGKTILTDQLDINEAFANKFQSQHDLTTNYDSKYDEAVGESLNTVETNNARICFNENIIAKIEIEEELDHTNENLPLSQINLLTCTEEVEKIIKRGINKKSSGSDNLPITLLKLFSWNNLNHITIFFNHLIAQSHFPNAWKTAIITPIPKAGKDLNSIANWRPISQLNNISKIYEKIIDARLNDSIERLGIYPLSQFGFRNKRNTIHPLVKFTGDVSTNLNKKLITTVVALDMQSAFDTVWHGGLLHKMAKFKMNIFLIKIIASFLKQRGFIVGNARFASQKRLIRAGTPQGSVLSPKLFNIFLSDIPVHNQIITLQFADDILFYLHHRKPVLSSMVFNSHLTNIFKFYTNWKLKINQNKTVLLNITGPPGAISKDLKNRLILQKIAINHEKISPTNSLKYLGITFTQNFNFIRQVDNIIKKVNFATSNLNSLLRSHFMESKYKTLIYKMYIRPLIQYGCEVWLNPSLISSHQVERIRIIERKIIRKTSNTRRCINSYKYIKNSELYAVSEIERIDRHLVKISNRFFNKCVDSEDEFIRNLIITEEENRFLHPSYIYHLNESDRLFVNNKLLIFHRGYRNPNDIVYNTGQ